MTTTTRTPRYVEAHEYAQSLRNREARNYAMGLAAYYREELNGRKGSWPWAFTPKSPTTAAKVANTIRHLLVGDCDASGTRLKAYEVSR